MRFDLRAEQLARRREPRLSPYAGIATRALALAADTGLAIVLFMALTGVLALVASLVGGLGSGWIAGAFLGWVALPLRRLLRPLLERRWPDARDAPAAAAGHHPRRSSALRVALARALLRPAPLDRAALRRLRPVLFSQRRRGLADFLAGTVVVYDEPPAAGEA